MELHNKERRIILNIINDMLSYPFPKIDRNRFNREELENLWNKIDKSESRMPTVDEYAKISEIIGYYLTLDNECDTTVGASVAEIERLKEKIQKRF
jgi:hypothetical protein